MKLKIYRSFWGTTDSPDQIAQGVLDSSAYDGIEAQLPTDGAARTELLGAARSRSLGFIPLVSIEGETPKEQLEEFRGRLIDAAETEPDCIVMQTGRDFWPLATAIEFYSSVVEIEQELDIRVAHETHRTRPLCTPWATEAILNGVPDLRLCCDFSHWVVVCERLLEDQEGAVGLAARHALHVHARVGSDQAPQVSDPAAPGAKPQLTAFERWWDQVWIAQARSGMEVTTLTPEYGPPPYQPVTASLPELSEQLSAICEWQANRARAHFQRSSVRFSPTAAFVVGRPL